MKSDLENQFLTLWKEQAAANKMQVETPISEYTFHPERKWRFDFAWPRFKLAVEIDGGSFTRGRHNTGMGSHLDKNKKNAAAALGWRILSFDVRHLKEPEYVFETIIESLTGSIDPPE